MLKKSSWLFSIPNAYLAMVWVVVLSNILVMYPINDWLTWGAFSYPLSFLVNELTNRLYGPQQARKVVYLGFIFAAILSSYLSTPQIAFASLSSFLISQLLDISIFNRLRKAAWWYGPLVASVSASLVDTAAFWFLAFWNEEISMILKLACGDFAVKCLMDIAFLLPFRLIMIRSLSLPAASPIRT